LCNLQTSQFGRSNRENHFLPAFVRSYNAGLSFVVLADALLHFTMLSTYYTIACTIAMQPCPAAFPDSLARQPYPSALLGSLALKYYKFNNRP
jgi:hypothetical protein